jgi:predicted Zn-dependent protease
MRSRIDPHRLAVFTIALLVVCAGGCATDKKVMAVADQAHTGLKPAVMEDPELAEYLQKVGDRIIETAVEMDRKGYGPKSHKSEDNRWMFSDKMRFYFVNSQTLNAFTTGGEHMYIYNGLFQECQSEDELAAVMAHEYGHVYARHVTKGMDRQLGQNVGTGVVAAGAGIAAFVLGGGVGTSVSTAQTAAGVSSTAGKFVGMGYTRGDEDEADKLGFAFYTHGGWDPNRFADFFRHMIEKGYDKTPEMMSDHPSLANRVANSERRVKELRPAAAQWRRPPVADARQFRALQQRGRQLAAAMPADKNLQQAQTMLAAFPSCVSPTDQPAQKEARKKVRSDARKAH